MPEKVTKVALTGGPCAGKSTVLAALKDKFGDDVMIVPEVATQLLEIPLDEGGVGIPGRDVEWSQKWQDNFQKRIIDKQIFDETYYVQVASQRERPTVLVCDRGVLDGAAYIEGGRRAFLEKYNLREQQCFALYDMVIHLNSLATDNPSLYDELKETNPSRFENLDRAKELDEKLFSAWEGHPNHKRTITTESPEAKIEICLQEIERLLGESRESKQEIIQEPYRESGESRLT